MSDETQFILGDAAVDATEEGRRGSRRQRKKRQGERVLTHCENCGAPLTGPYCGQCGQHAVDYKRSLWRVLVDAADSFLNWDTKFLSSLVVLLTRPWKLTNDFNAGRRASYVHPLRLYLLASIAFFLVVKLVNFEGGGVLEFSEQDRTQLAAALGKLTGTDSPLTTEQQTTLESFRSRLAETNGALSESEKKELKALVQSALATKMKAKMERGERARLKSALARIPEIPTPEEAAKFGKEAADEGRAVAAEATREAAAEIAAEKATEPPPAVPAMPGVVPAMPNPPGLPGASPKATHHEPHISFGPQTGPKTPFENWMQKKIQDKVGGDGTKTKLFLDTLRNNIPTMMLCCIPLFALVLKMLYLGKRRYYVEHLVYALHIHTFLYVGVVVTTLLGLALAHWSDVARALLATALGLTMFVQIFLSIRRVYGQGWFFTTFKFLLGGFVYFLILVCAVGITAVVTLLLPD